MLFRSHEMLSLQEALRQDAAHARGLQEGILRVGSFGSTSSLRILPDLLARYAQRHPGITVRIDEEDDDTVVRWPEERRVEIGFVVLPDERFETWPVAEDEFLVMLPEHHPLAAKPAIHPSDLTGEPFVLSGAGCGDLIQNALARHGARLNILYRFPQLLSLLGFIQRGLAVSVAAVAKACFAAVNCVSSTFMKPRKFTTSNAGNGRVNCLKTSKHLALGSFKR